MTHNDELPLLRAIAESPEDLTLRQIYADWCEEHGQPERAALIRGQCLLEPLFTHSAVDAEYEDPRCLTPCQLSAGLRESVLSAFRPFGEACGWDWENPGQAFRHESHLRIRRGFVEGFGIQGIRRLSAWVEYAADILDRTPLLSLWVWRLYGGSDPTHIPVEIMRRFLAVEGIKRLQTLHLGSYNLGPAAAQVLLDSGGGWQLRKLSLSERSLGRGVRDKLQERFGDALHLAHAADEDDIPF